MATGPEHYRQAEKHLHHAACAAGVEPDNEARHLSYAQVHTTLALAAATVDQLTVWKSWRDVIEGEIWETKE